jgi:hypothetical protein
LETEASFLLSQLRVIKGRKRSDLISSQPVEHRSVASSFISKYLRKQEPE